MAHEKTFAERLLAERKRRGLTREQLATEFGTSPPNVRSWERGFTEPREEMRAVVEKWLRNGKR